MKKMQCPYLSGDSKKVCLKMIEAKMPEEISDFDIKHFCEGEPTYCYYFRLATTQEATKNSTNKQENTPSILTPTIQEKA
jgi:hypothetical protein